VHRACGRIRAGGANRHHLERGRPAAALAKLDDVLDRHAKDVVENLEPQIYLDRARARAALGQSADAYADVKHSLELQQSLNREQRSRSAAVLKGAADAEKLASSNRLLEEHVARQRAELSNRTLTQRLAVAVAVAAAVVSALFAYLLWITRRHGRSIRRQQAVLRTVSLHAPDALMLLDDQRRVRFGNRHLFGGARPPEPGQALEGVVPVEALQPVRDALEDLFENGRSTTFTVRVTDPSEVVRQFEIRGVPVIEDGQLLGAMLRSTDVTDERRLEREVINVATRERQRISNDLHEGLGQDLAGVSMLLEGIARDIDRGGPVSRAEVRKLAGHVNQMIATTRDIAYSLSPVQIARGSVSSAIGRLADEASAALNVEISMQSDPADIMVSEDTADHLCRIAVEAVTTTARRPGCRRVEVELRIEEGVLRLTVTGDGDVVASETAHAGHDVGEMLAYRVRLLGGNAQIQREPGRGRRTSVTVPMTKRA
jgi:signal transduction histidine kinase